MPEPIIVIPGDDDQNRGYRVGKWMEYDNFECIHCQCATLWKDKIIKHLEEGNHDWAYPQTQTEKQDLKKDEPEY